MNVAELGERIRDLRKVAGYSQERLCAEAGFSKKVIQDIESGSGNPTLDSLIAIAGVLKVDMGSLFGNVTPHSNRRADSIAALIALLPALNELELKALLSQAQESPSIALKARVSGK